MYLKSVFALLVRAASKHLHVSPSRCVIFLLCVNLVSCTNANDGQAPDSGATHPDNQSGPVRVLGPETGSEALSLRAAFDDFTTETGIEVEYEASRFANSNLDIDVASGNPPDIAFVAQPGRIADFAAQGNIKPIPYDLTKSLVSSFDPALLNLGRAGGSIYAVPIKVDVKNIIWYSPKAFTEAGYDVPKSLEELEMLTEEMRSTDTNPWCIGMADGDATGWVFTDWVEQMMLTLHGPRIYDRWSSNQLPFDAPEVQEAVDAVASIWFTEGNVRSGREEISSTPYVQAGLDLIDQACFMHRQLSSFSTFYLEAGASVGPDGDINAFAFPPKTVGAPQQTLTAGNFAIAFSNEKPVMQLMSYLATREYANSRIQTGTGSYLVPHKDQSTSLYKQDIDRLFASMILDAESLRFDASDLMPPEIGTGAFWIEGVNYVDGKIDTQTFLSLMEEEWPEPPDDN